MIVRTLKDWTFWSMGGSPHKLDCGALCNVTMKWDYVLQIQPIDPDLDHLWSTIAKKNVEYLTAMHVLAEFAK